jgi:hypothetical protein
MRQGLQAEHEFYVCIHELLLHKLEQHEWTLELEPLEHILLHVREAHLKHAHDTPGDSIAQG